MHHGHATPAASHSLDTLRSRTMEILHLGSPDYSFRSAAYYATAVLSTLCERGGRHNPHKTGINSPPAVEDVALAVEYAPMDTSSACLPHSLLHAMDAYASRPLGAAAPLPATRHRRSAPNVPRCPVGD